MTRRQECKENSCEKIPKRTFPRFLKKTLQGFLPETLQGFMPETLQQYWKRGDGGADQEKCRRFLLETSKDPCWQVDALSTTRWGQDDAEDSCWKLFKQWVNTDWRSRLLPPGAGQLEAEQGQERWDAIQSIPILSWWDCTYDKRGRISPDSGSHGHFF